MPAKTLAEKIKEAPKAPGCYLFYDGQGRILYVGKAKSLASRVRQYFHAAAREDERIAPLVPRIADVQYVTTPTETDALLEEYRLIKLHKPWFNAQLKRDTEHPYLRIGLAEAFPSISVAWQEADGGAAYYGCFFDIYDAEEAMELLGDVWKTPRCGKAPLPERPCLYHGMGKCAGPCGGHIAQDAYRAAIGEISALLAGEDVPALASLRARVAEHAAALAFEKAQETQALLDRLERLRQKGRKIFRLPEDRDVYVLLRAYREASFSVFLVRGGAVAKRTILSGGDADVKALAGAYFAQPEPQENGRFLAQSIAEVLAEKSFFVVPGGITRPALEKALRAQLKAFGG